MRFHSTKVCAMAGVALALSAPVSAQAAGTAVAAAGSAQLAPGEFSQS